MAFTGRSVSSVGAGWAAALPADTQCGSKVFRAGPELRAVLGTPFHTRWVFDCEIIGRFAALRRRSRRPSVAESIFEYPLHRWEDVAGSKVKLGDIAKMAWGLLTVRRIYIWGHWPPRTDLEGSGSGGGGGGGEEAGAGASKSKKAKGKNTE